MTIFDRHHAPWAVALRAARTATWKAQLNIENIFNKGYWASADGNNNLSPDQPRTYRFKVTAKL